MTAGKEIRQWVTTQDGLENVRLDTAPMPEVKSDEVLVKINVVSLNYRDTEGETRSSLTAKSNNQTDECANLG